jgi:SepF-like predicted cell division protein (DUF552 family)
MELTGEYSVADPNQYLSVAENEALINPALRQTARTLDVFLGFAAIASMPDANVVAGVERIRSFDKKEAKRTRQELVRATRLLTALSSEAMDIEELVVETHMGPNAEQRSMPVEVAASITDNAADELRDEQVPQVVVVQQPDLITATQVTVEPLPVIEVSPRATEPSIDIASITIVESTASTPEIVTEKNESLGSQARAVRYLTDIFGDKTFIESLTIGDVSTVLSALDAIYGGEILKNDRTAIESMLKGTSHEKIAELLGSTAKSATNAVANRLSLIKTAIKSSSGYSPDAALVILKTLMMGEDIPERSPDALIETKPTLAPVLRPVPGPRSVVVPVVVPEKKPEDMIEESRMPLGEAYALIRQAVDNPKLVSVRDWMTAAEDFILTAYARVGTADEANAVWNRIHIDENEMYKAKETVELQSAIKKLASIYVAKSNTTRTFDNKPFETICLRTILNWSMGYKTLDQIRLQLTTKFPKITENQTQRYTVAAIAELLKDDA